MKFSIHNMLSNGKIAGLIIVLDLLIAIIPGSIFAQASCTYTIPQTMTDLNGSQFAPGSVLCFPAGTRDNIKISNLNGTSTNPIIIKNNGGVTRITGLKYLTGGIGLYNSSYIRITGTGVSNQCGSEFVETAQQCGIDIVGTYQGISTPNGDVQNIEIDHVSVRNTDKSRDFAAGIGIHPNNGVTLTGINLHHNYILDTKTEGFYVGSDPNKTIPNNGILRNVTVSYNLVKDTGFDGINVKQASNISVHHNKVINTGLINGQVDHVPEGGIQMVNSDGEIYNNLVIDSKDTGINMGRRESTLGTIVGKGNSTYYNNVVVRSTQQGIGSAENAPKIYNNTVISNNIGIDATGSSAQIFDNIVVNSLTTQIRKGSTGTSVNNYVGTTASVSFANPSLDNYHLTSSSSVALDKGGNTFPPFDYDDNQRPSGSQSDLGAYEYAGNSTTPTITVRPTSTLTPTTRAKPGDANNDNKVDGIDYSIWVSRYNQSTSNGYRDGDFNGDGKVDGIDYLIWLSNYGT